MEDYKIKGEAKSIVLDNGAEITYLELGENNEEVLISGTSAKKSFDMRFLQKKNLAGT